MTMPPPLRWMVLLGTPLALTVLMLFHPWPCDDYLSELVPIATWWTILHAAQFILFAFMGAAVWLLTDSLRGIPVLVNRVAAVAFVLAYNLGDALAGVATGVLARSAQGRPAAEQAAAAAAIGALFQAPLTHTSFVPGTYAWVVALAAAALALHRAGAPRVPLVLLALPAYPLFGFDQAVPFGSLACGSSFSIALWLEFGGRKPASSRANRSQITPLSQRE